MSKQWASLAAFVNDANAAGDWVLLRDPAEGDDIDILCANKDTFTKRLGLQKRNTGISAYQASIADVCTPVDVRFVGDGYYDEAWQEAMLSNRNLTTDHCPVLNDNDSFYSLLYHAQVHKYKTQQKYKPMLQRLAKKIGHTYTPQSLQIFLQEHKYTTVTPLDVSVRFNMPRRFQKGIPVKYRMLHALTRWPFCSLVRIVPRSIKLYVQHKMLPSEHT